MTPEQEARLVAAIEKIGTELDNGLDAFTSIALERGLDKIADAIKAGLDNVAHALRQGSGHGR